MTFAKLILALACLMSSAQLAQEAKVTQLLSKDLKESPGKEGLMINVKYPPGSSGPIHRHNAHAFVYVLEGSIVTQVRGGKQKPKCQASAISAVNPIRRQVPSMISKDFSGVHLHQNKIA